MIRACRRASALPSSCGRTPSLLRGSAPHLRPVMRDDGLGGPHHRPAPDASAELRIAVWHWRLRLAILSVIGVLVMEGQASAIALLAAFGLAVIVMLGGSAMARVELRLRGRVRRAR